MKLHIWIGTCFPTCVRIYIYVYIEIFIYSFIYLFVYSFFCLFSYLRMYVFIYWFIYSFYLFVYLIVYLLIYRFHSINVWSFMYLNLCWLRRESAQIGYRIWSWGFQFFTKYFLGKFAWCTCDRILYCLRSFHCSRRPPPHSIPQPHCPFEILLYKLSVPPSKWNFCLWFPRHRPVIFELVMLFGSSFMCRCLL